MGKDFLNKIKAGLDKVEEKKQDESVENNTAAAPVEPENSVKTSLKSEGEKQKPNSKKQPAKQATTNEANVGLDNLYQLLQEEKEEFNIGKEVVYLDEELFSILLLLKRKAKIKPSLLTSYLLKKFFTENKELANFIEENKEIINFHKRR